MRLSRPSLIWTGVSVLAAIVLWPSDALAFGPAAHLDFGVEVLEHAALLAPALRRLLLAHADDFLYGCTAADIVVGKNFARERHHCHNWKVGLEVLARAASPRQRALGYGFLCHLAADTIAHNYFVPYKTVESFRAVTAKHAYWELRFDKAALERPSVREVLRRVGRARFPSHDRFLGELLAEGSRLFSFPTSRRIFSTMLRLSRLRRWQQMVARLADRSPLPLHADEIRDFRGRTLDAVFACLIDAEASRTMTVDPTGLRTLRVATQLRLELRDAWKEGRLPERSWPAIARDLRARFLAGVHGRLDVPDVRALLARAARG